MSLQFISEADESRLLTEVMTAYAPHLRPRMFSISDLRPPGDNVANPHEAAAPDVRRRASLRWNRPAAVAAFPACNRERSTMSAHCSPRARREEACSEACHSFAQLCYATLRVAKDWSRPARFRTAQTTSYSTSTPMGAALIRITTARCTRARTGRCRAQRTRTATAWRDCVPIACGSGAFGLVQRSAQALGTSELARHPSAHRWWRS